MEKLTLGQVIDRLELDQVAIKVDGNFGKSCRVEGRQYLNVGLHFDEYDSNILKSLNGTDVCFAKPSGTEMADYFIIMSKSAYRRIAEELLEI